MRVEPLVTVVVPCYNHEKYIQETLMSIYDQTYSNIELIVIDDGSTDNSFRIINELANGCSFRKRFTNVIVKSNKNMGLINTLNEGFQIASGRFVAQIASDDLFLPNHLEIAVNYLIKDEKIGLFFSNPYIIKGDIRTNEKLIRNGKYILKKIEDKKHYEELLYKNYLPGSTIVYNAEVFQTCGFMDPLLRNRGEISLHWKIASKYDFCFYNEATGYYRIHENSTWINLKKDINKLKEDYIKLIEIFEKSEFCRDKETIVRAKKYIAYDYDKKIFKTMPFKTKVKFLLGNFSNILKDFNKLFFEVLG